MPGSQPRISPAKSFGVSILPEIGDGTAPADQDAAADVDSAPDLVVVQAWEMLPECKCVVPMPLPKLIPGESRIRCFACVRPFRARPASSNLPDQSRIWESIVRKGLRLVRKRRLWGVLGGYLRSIKQRGLQEGLPLADKRRFWGQLGGYLKSKKGTSKIMACPSLSPLT